jgi:hypothetical protein
MKLRVLHHNHCFDGLASAAVFSRFYLEKVNKPCTVEYSGLTHIPNQKRINEELLDGDENVIVDFKFSSSANLTWWFDHHQSAFLSKEDEEFFYREKSPTKFYAPDYRSCTKLIADTLERKYGFAEPGLSELVSWADIIDGALYESPKAAVELESPALKLMLVIEAARTDGLMSHIIRCMQEKPLADIMQDSLVKAEFTHLYERHRRTIEFIREASSCESGVVFFDVSGHDTEGYSKFIPYYLYPECTYSVGVSLSALRAKISVGYNPWSPSPRKHNLASICERYNGGGHPVVGAISFRPDEIEIARKAGIKIASELRS